VISSANVNAVVGPWRSGETRDEGSGEPLAHGNKVTSAKAHRSSLTPTPASFSFERFGAAMKYLSTLGPSAKLRLYHEVTVPAADEQFFEYAGCHPRTGMLAAVETVAA